MKRKDKSTRLAEVLSKDKGMAKGLIVNLLTSLKIGQTLFLRYNLDSKGTIDNLAKVVNFVAEGKEKEDIVKVMEKVQGKGFTLVTSMVNFTSQLDPDQLINLQSLLQDEKGTAGLKKSVAYLLDNYEYRQ